MATLKQQRLANINTILVNNSAVIQSGLTLSREEFIELFDIEDVVNIGDYQKVHRSNLKLLSMQTDINLLLRESGLYMTSEEYYSYFHIMEKENTKQTILRYSSEVDICKTSTDNLENCMVSRTKSKTWGHYANVSTETIKSITKKPKSVRHIRKINRLKGL